MPSYPARGGNMSYDIRKVHLALLLATSALVPTGAVAQVTTPDAQAKSAPQASAGVSSETVVVTARRRDEQLKDVPTAITVFTADKLDDIGAKDITELTRSTPNLTLQVARGSNSTVNVFMRGVGQGDPLWGFEPGVGLYVDDVYYARPQGAILDIYNIDRIEVLRGPQGTLYGRNTEGGAVKFVTAALPDERAFSSKGTRRHLWRDRRQPHRVGALTDTLRIGGGFEHLQHGGFGKNLLTGVANDDQDVTAGRLTANTGRPTICSSASRPTSMRQFATARRPPPDARHARQRADHQQCLGQLFRHVAEEPSSTISAIRGWRSGRHRTNGRSSRSPPIATVRPTPISTSPRLRARNCRCPASIATTRFTEELQALYTASRLNGVAGLYYRTASPAGGADTILGNAGLTLYFAGNARTHSLAAYTDVSYDVTDALQFGRRALQ